jgi:hypothetical protein
MVVGRHGVRDGAFVNALFIDLKTVLPQPLIHGLRIYLFHYFVTMPVKL